MASRSSAEPGLVLLVLPGGAVEKEKGVEDAAVVGLQAEVVLWMVPLTSQRAVMQPPMPSVVS